MQDPATGPNVTGYGEGLADQGVGLVVGAGVVAVQHPGEGSLGVAGGHPDGAGDLLDLGVQHDGAGRDVTEPGPRGRAAAAARAASALARAASTGACRSLRTWLVMTVVPGAGARSCSRAASLCCSAASAAAPAFLALVAAAFFARLGTSRPGSSGAAA